MFAERKAARQSGTQSLRAERGRQRVATGRLEGTGLPEPPQEDHLMLPCSLPSSPALLRVYRDLDTLSARSRQMSVSMFGLLTLRRPGLLPLRWFVMDELLPRLVRVLRDTADVLCALRRLDDALEGYGHALAHPTRLTRTA
jgi:hypothetical protein